MTRSIRWIFIFILFLWLMPVHATIEDNRFFPFYDRFFARSSSLPSRSGVDVFFITAKEGRGHFDDKARIPELRGCFDQITIGKAVEAIGEANPLRPDLQTVAEIPWAMEGKLQGQGFGFCYEQALSDYFSVGLSGLFFHLSSRIEFCLSQSTQAKLGLVEGGAMRLDRERREAMDILGLEAPQWSVSQLGDFDLYLRIGKIWEYLLRTKRIDISLQAGALIPTGQARDESNPASIPFGGDDHWGGYVQLNTDFELKEDLKVGNFFRLSKRRAKTRHRRMPVAGEPLHFGAVCGLAEVDPGLTFSFSPYVAVEELREGLGFCARYTYVNHRSDCWTDKRNDKSVAVALAPVVASSDWVSEYFTFNLFYDFGKTEDDPSYVPRLSVAFEIPGDIIGARKVSKTHRVSLGFEVMF